MKQYEPRLQKIIDDWTGAGWTFHDEEGAFYFTRPAARNKRPAANFPPTTEHAAHIAHEEIR